MCSFNSRIIVYFLNQNFRLSLTDKRRTREWVLAGGGLLLSLPGEKGSYATDFSTFQELAFPE